MGDFAEIALGQNQFLQQFMTRAGLPQPPTVDYEPVRNRSLSARGLEIALSINPHLSSASERKETRLFLQKHFSNQLEDRARPIPEDLRRSVQDQTAAEYEALAARPPPLSTPLRWWCPCRTPDAPRPGARHAADASSGVSVGRLRAR